MVTTTTTTLTDALAERDRILADLDVDAAKAFIVRHGGVAPKRSMDWLRVLHLARFECRSIPPELVGESRVYLARTGAQLIADLPERSPYLRAALDLVFPKDLTDAMIADLEASR